VAILRSCSLTGARVGGLLIGDTLTGASLSCSARPRYTDRRKPYRDWRGRDTLTGASHTCSAPVRIITSSAAGGESMADKEEPSTGPQVETLLEPKAKLNLRRNLR
jgi:hypothetical protein